MEFHYVITVEVLTEEGINITRYGSGVIDVLPGTTREEAFWTVVDSAKREMSLYLPFTVTFFCLEPNALPGVNYA